MLVWTVQYNFFPLLIKLFENFDLNEDTSAVGGAPSNGMGAVVNSQPSSLPGTTFGVNWSANGGTEGSGDVSAPYNAGGGKVMQQKFAMGSNHGPRTGTKSRKKKIDMKALKASFDKIKKDKDSGAKGPGKVMSFDNFIKSNIEKIKK